MRSVRTGGSASVAPGLSVLDQEIKAIDYRLEQSCTGVLNRTIIDPIKLPRDTIAEVSRLNGGWRVPRERKGESNSSISLADEHLDMERLPRFPYIPIGLLFGTTELARLNGIEYSYSCLPRNVSPITLQNWVSSSRLSAPQLSITVSGCLQ